MLKNQHLIKFFKMEAVQMEAKQIKIVPEILELCEQQVAAHYARKIQASGQDVTLEDIQAAVIKNRQALSLQTYALYDQTIMLLAGA